MSKISLFPIPIWAAKRDILEAKLFPFLLASWLVAEIPIPHGGNLFPLFLLASIIIH